MAAIVDAAQGKEVKDVLKARGWLETTLAHMVAPYETGSAGAARRRGWRP